MDKSQEEYYSNFRELFLTKGWDQLKNILLENINSINIETLQDSKDLYRTQGKIEILKNLYNLQDTLKAQEVYLEEQDLEEAV